MNRYLLFKQLNKKHGDELKVFYSFHSNMKIMLLKRHKHELIHLQYPDQEESLLTKHKKEIEELAESEALALEFLYEKQKQEKATLKRA